MALLNIGAGLSQMGGAIAQTAGSEAIELQKSQLESQRDVLLNQMQAQREHVGRVETGQIETGLEAQRIAGQEAVTGMQTTSAEKIAGGEQATQQKVAQINAGAMLTAEREQGWGLQFDQGSGNAILMNPRTGESKPLLGPDNKPLSVVNTAMVPVAQAVWNSNNEQIRAENQQFATQMSSLQKQYDDMGQNPLLKMNQKDLDAARAPITQRMDDLKAQHENAVGSLRASNAQALDALSRRGATIQAPAQGNTQPGNAAQANTPAAKAPTPGAPPGGGTRANPYMPATQQQIDWLRDNGQGAWYKRPGDDKLYQVGQ